jgi:signal transduction histidine kinase
MAQQFGDDQVPTVKTEPAVRQEGFRPQWIVAEGRMPELVFTRVVDGPWGTVQQGFWLDWPALESQLLSSVKDTAPGASLKPVLQKSLPDEVMGRMLATVPAELVMPQPALAGSAWTPLRTALVATWLLVLAAMLTLAWLARAADKLAENRGRFVTAVTHELRTPLTSFCMYSQMLADDMVTDEAARKEYARTLHGQSLRLSRIVESVLDYARLGRARRPVEATTVGAVRERIEPGLHAICERAGLQLVIEPPPAGWERAALRTDLDTIDRVLTNLVDNACKYGGRSEDQQEGVIGEQPANQAGSQTGSQAAEQDRVMLSWRVEGQTLIAHVRDFGPGIPAADRERIFQAFERGSKHAGGATPGLGLGLALSHAMAQEIGGGLSLAHVGEGERGAAFELKLKLYS